MSTSLSPHLILSSQSHAHHTLHCSPLPRLCPAFGALLLPFRTRAAKLLLRRPVSLLFLSLLNVLTAAARPRAPPPLSSPLTLWIALPALVSLTVQALSPKLQARW